VASARRTLGGVLLLACAVACTWQSGAFAEAGTTGLRGDAEAIADAQAMVETMGGAEVWAQLESIHFVHRWYPWNKVDPYVEDEILDLTGPRSWVERKGEDFHQVRAYSPEGKYWSITNGEFAYSSDEVFENAMKRAPFNFYHLVRAVAIGDPFYEVRFGEGDIPQTRRIEFYGPDGVLRGWVILNAGKEPIVKATTEYRYTFGPMKQFGNLRIPAWGIYGNGLTRFEMISVTGDSEPPPSNLFQPPAEFRDG
jgi:hypothetical protein